MNWTYILAGIGSAVCFGILVYRMFYASAICCGRRAKKIAPGSAFYSATYQCRVCNNQFITWSETP